MSKNLLSSLRRGINLNRKTAGSIFSTYNAKALDPKRPYVVGTTNTYCIELFNVAVAQLRTQGIVPATAMVRTPAQLAQFLTDAQCALIQMFIAPRPKNRSEAYSFENAEITFLVARKGDKDLNQGDVAATHEIAALLKLPVDQILISKVGAVDPDSTPAVIIQDADPFGGAYAGMLPNAADQNDDFDEEEEEEEEDDTVYSAADAATLNRAQIEKLLGAAAKFTKSGNPTAATLSAVVGKPKLV